MFAPSAFPIRRRAAATLGLLVGLAVGTVGCSLGGGAGGGAGAPTAGATTVGGASSRPAATKVDPCTLITESEATTALGSDPGPGTKDDPNHCTYRLQRDIGQGGSITVDAMPGDAALYASDRNTNQPSSAAEVQDVNGVGDAAFASFSKVTDFASGSIVVLKGSTIVDVIFNLTAAPTVPVLATLTTLAEGRSWANLKRFEVRESDASALTEIMMPAEASA